VQAIPSIAPRRTKAYQHLFVERAGMRSHAIVLLLAAISPSSTDDRYSCYESIGKSCPQPGIMHCCTTQGFVYCGWTSSTFAWAPTLRYGSYCHTWAGSCYVCKFSDGLCSTDDSTWLERVSNTGDVIVQSWTGGASEQIGWNILADTTGYLGDVP
jgi:hypothetical protein